MALSAGSFPCPPYIQNEEQHRKVIAQWMMSVSPLNPMNQAQSGFFFSDLGGKVNRIADRLFVGPAVEADGNSIPTSSTWVASPSSGIYKYLEWNSTFNAYATGAGIGIFGAARASDALSHGGTLSMGIGSFVYNDVTASAVSVFALYGTALHALSATGVTHALELDIGNMGATVPLYPNAIFANAATMAAWICTGGETTNVGSPGIASVAIGIVQNDSQVTPTSFFDKGIVFHSQAISGCNGSAGVGQAIAFAKGHQMTWWNNANEVVGFMRSDGTSATLAAAIIFSDYGLIINNAYDSTTQFRIECLPAADNYLHTVPANTGTAPQLKANGSSLNIDLSLAGKGTGVLQFGTFTATAIAVVTGFIEIKDIAGNTRKLLVG